MAKTINRLSAVKVNKISKTGWYADGAGLYLQVSKTGAKSWVYRYETAGKERRHGLGRYSSTDNSLIDARIAAGECRKLRRQGIDPIEHKRQHTVAQRLEDAKTITFKECALAYIDTQKSGWKNPKHEMYWRNTLKTAGRRYRHTIHYPSWCCQFFSKPGFFKSIFLYLYLLEPQHQPHQLLTFNP